MQYPLTQQMFREIETNVDIVFVVDATEKMQVHIDKIKTTVLNFPHMLTDEFQKCRRHVNHLRCKVVWFRDFYRDGINALGESRFFSLPQEKCEYVHFVEDIRARGGCNKAASGLEALTLAMRSDFTQAGDRRRHIIILFSDSEAYAFEDHARHVEEAIEEGFSLDKYPADMPKTLSEFYGEWSPLASPPGHRGLDFRSKRLVLITSESYPWTELESDFDACFREKIDGSNTNFDDILALCIHGVR